MPDACWIHRNVLSTLVLRRSIASWFGMRLSLKAEIGLSESSFFSISSPSLIPSVQKPLSLVDHLKSNIRESLTHSLFFAVTSPL
jgi:hypothetical protein